MFVWCGEVYDVSSVGLGAQCVLTFSFPLQLVNALKKPLLDVTECDSPTVCCGCCCCGLIVAGCRVGTGVQLVKHLAEMQVVSQTACLRHGTSTFVVVVLVVGLERALFGDTRGEELAFCFIFAKD